MKLVEIKDIRPGQVWQDKDGDLWLEWDDRIEPPIRDTKYYAHTKEAFNYLVERKNKLVGFWKITHKAKDKELVEIPRTTEFQTDDVVKFKWSDPRLYVINREIDFGIKETHPNNHCFEATNGLYGSRQLVDFELKRIGILGVTHEFVNDKER